MFNNTTLCHRNKENLILIYQSCDNKFGSFNLSIMSRGDCCCAVKSMDTLLLKWERVSTHFCSATVCNGQTHYCFDGKAELWRGWRRAARIEAAPIERSSSSHTRSNEAHSWILCCISSQARRIHHQALLSSASDARSPREIHPSYFLRLNTTRSVRMIGRKYWWDK